MGIWATRDVQTPRYQQIYIHKPLQTVHHVIWLVNFVLWFQRLGCVFFRRMLKIPWTRRVRKAEVLYRTDTKTEIMKNIRQKLLRFLIHVMKLQQLENVRVT